MAEQVDDRVPAARYGDGVTINMRMISQFDTGNALAAFDAGNHPSKQHRRASRVRRG